MKSDVVCSIGIDCCDDASASPRHLSMQIGETRTYSRISSKMYHGGAVENNVFDARTGKTVCLSNGRDYLARQVHRDPRTSV